MKAGDDDHHEQFVGLPDAGVDDRGGSGRTRRLDLFGLAVRQQLGADLFGAPLLLGDVAAEPPGELLGVRDTADSEPGVVANLPAVPAAGPAGEVVEGNVRGRHLHLTAQVLQRGARKFEAAAGKPALPQQELEHRNEPEPSRPELVAQQRQFTPVKGEVLQDVVEVQIAGHPPVVPSAPCATESTDHTRAAGYHQVPET
ncbi:MAG TPA: hypothetical protein VII33_17765 [Nakamurella sp.]